VRGYPDNAVVTGLEGLPRAAQALQVHALRLIAQPFYACCLLLGGGYLREYPDEEDPS